ncbi:MAG: hypothetical protein CVU57_26445 [Deltaproteobacteria bacterium HGW-Deltaproteobacteria-15]|nr:MAG: hypothetical protein CVU57_26445 [Deltaproteobacteria bacterium HGW-Deltaproteobacteria-15]
MQSHLVLPFLSLQMNDTRIKFEIRSTKSETNSNDRKSNAQNKTHSVENDSQRLRVKECLLNQGFLELALQMLILRMLID